MARQENETGLASEVPQDYYERTEHTVRRRIAGRVRTAHTVVDFGCGSCDLARFLADRNDQDVVGVDIRDGSFPREESLSPHVGCRKADARRLDFLRDGSVDAVVSVHALHEMADPVAVLREARRVLRGGGLALVVDFPRDSLAQRLWHERYFTATEVAEMLEEAGFPEADAHLTARGQLIWAEARKQPGAGARP